MSIAAFLALGGCGSDGGGGVAGTPTPVPSPTPTPASTNSAISNLVASQTFVTDASTQTVSIDLTAKTTSNGTAAGQTLSVAYDATANSYTITTPSHTATFLSSDAQNDTTIGEKRFARTAGSSRDYLTTVTTPYSGNTSNRYVALGYYQHNDIGSNSQATSFDAFTFGFETPAAALPRTGQASWTTDIFGFYTVPGQTPRTIQGGGDFTVNLAKGLFTTTTSVTQYDFLTGASLIGGGIDVVAQGTIGSGNSFSGNLEYGGSFGAVAGTINGRFYGPNADEVGAAFHADNATGAVLDGALTGQRKSSATPINFTLDSIASDQLFYSIWATQQQSTPSSGGTSFFAQSPQYGQTTFHADGSFLVVTPVSDLGSATFTAADRLPTSRIDFASYQKTVDGAPLRVDLYRPDGSTQAITLTYAGFGIWSRTAPFGSVGQTTNGYFTYGFATPRDTLDRRTGTASYDGVAYGTAGASNGSRYDVGGTSHFDVDFGNQRFAGSLALTTRPEGSSATATALGTWQFGANMGAGQLVQTALNGSGAAHPFNTITPQLYGPDGQEIAAPFTIVTGATVNGQAVSVAGVTVAKRQ